MGRAIAEPKKKGRPPGRREPLHRGEAKLVRLLDQASKILGHDHEVVKELIQLELQVARGKVTGRYVGFRLAAAGRLLDRLIGKPVQPIEKRDESIEDILLEMHATESAEDQDGEDDA